MIITLLPPKMVLMMVHVEIVIDLDIMGTIFLRMYNVTGLLICFIIYLHSFEIKVSPKDIKNRTVFYRHRRKL